MSIQRYLLLIFVGLICLVSEGQTIYSYNGKYRIELPDKLELQDSELNTVRCFPSHGNKTQAKVSTNSKQIIFQQKGLNAGIKDAYNRYCRVIVEFFQEDRSDPTFGKGDQIVVDKDLLNTIHNSVQEACNRNNTPLLKLFNVQPLSINGFPVLYYSYKRKGWEGKQPPVIVNVYQIFNRYESVSLTFSYREEERDIWKNIHGNITNSFSFIVNN